jgi:hypothetical protein
MIVAASYDQAEEAAADARLSRPKWRCFDATLQGGDRAI